MVTPHLPPEQAANALLPPLLARELERSNVASEFVAHQHGQQKGGKDVTWVTRRGRSSLARTTPGALFAAGRMAARAYGPIARSDLVHLHSNGLIVEVAGTIARRLGKPYVVTLYGTDVWHHQAERQRRFGRIVHAAAHRVFYSHALLEHARPLGLAPAPSSVIYAPVDACFHLPPDEERGRIREEIAPGASHVLLSVKRLHAVGGQQDLIAALPRILKDTPEALLLLVGEGDLRAELERQATTLGVNGRVRFVGRVDNRELWRYYAAADLFILSSHLESWGTVMLEALACGTPVVASDTAGASEVRAHFQDDVMLYERGNVQDLVRAVDRALNQPRRAAESTRRTIRSQFSPAACAASYYAVYEQAIGSGESVS